MKLIAFIQMFNESTKGNLVRCLENCKLWADDIVIYDDASTDDSVEIASRYTSHIIRGTENSISKELSHKQELLEYAKTLNPDWIFWIDCDEILDANACNGGLRALCEKNMETKVDAFSFHELNLWRGETYYRKDSLFHSGWFVRLWRVTPNIHFAVKDGVHLRIYPITIETVEQAPFEVIHYGFCHYKQMLKKIGADHWTEKEFQTLGVDNWILNETQCNTRKVDPALFPDHAKPKDYWPRSFPRKMNQLIPYNKIQDELTEEETLRWWRSQQNYFTDMIFEHSDINVIRLFGLHKSSRILEIGCGYGRELSQFTKISKNVKGCDLHPRSIELSRENCEKHGEYVPELKVYDGVYLPFESKSMDFVYSCFVIQHISKRNAFKLLVETLRVLDDYGSILFEFFGHPDYMGTLDNNAYSFAPDGSKMYNNSFTREDIELLIKQANEECPCNLIADIHWKVGEGNTSFTNHWVHIRKVH